MNYRNYCYPEDWENDCDYDEMNYNQNYRNFNNYYNNNDYDNFDCYRNYNRNQNCHKRKEKREHNEGCNRRKRCCLFNIFHCW